MIKTQIWGNLAADPELREVEVGEDKPDALRVVLWGVDAENAAKYLKKGSGVAAAGDLDINTYEKDGVKHTSVELVNVDLSYTDKKKD